MKNFNKYLFTFLAIIICQLITINTFAQTATEKETRTKCERCADYLSTNNMTDYAEENCRIYRMVCNKLDNEPIIIGENSGSKLISFDSKTTQSLVIFTDGFNKISHEVTPKVSVLNMDKEVIATIETNIFQQYTIDEAGKLQMKGISKIKQLGSEKRILMTAIDIPKIVEENIYIQVAFLYFNPHNQQNEVAETITTQYEIK
ncbi:MAG: hypothetical protein AB8G11_12065 [Saprospiraceae bacterium]